MLDHLKLKNYLLNYSFSHDTLTEFFEIATFHFFEIVSNLGEKYHTWVKIQIIRYCDEDYELIKKIYPVNYELKWCFEFQKLKNLVK